MKTKTKSNRYYWDIIKEAEQAPSEETRKEAIKACDVLIKRYRKMQEWGFRFCGDIANLAHLENTREEFTL